MLLAVGVGVGVCGCGCGCVQEHNITEYQPHCKLVDSVTSDAALIWDFSQYSDNWLFMAAAD